MFETICLCLVVLGFPIGVLVGRFGLPGILWVILNGLNAWAFATIIVWNCGERGYKVRRRWELMRWMVVNRRVMRNLWE